MPVYFFIHYPLVGVYHMVPAALLPRDTYRRHASQSALHAFSEFLIIFLGTRSRAKMTVIGTGS